MRRQTSVQCPVCDGLGVIDWEVGAVNYKVDAETCSVCRGTGRMQPARPGERLLRATRHAWQRVTASRPAVHVPDLPVRVPATAPVAQATHWEMRA